MEQSNAMSSNVVSCHVAVLPRQDALGQGMCAIIFVLTWRASLTECAICLASSSSPLRATVCVCVCVSGRGCRAGTSSSTSCATRRPSRRSRTRAARCAAWWSTDTARASDDARCFYTPACPVDGDGEKCATISPAGPERDDVVAAAVEAGMPIRFHPGTDHASRELHGASGGRSRGTGVFGGCRRRGCGSLNRRAVARARRRRWQLSKLSKRSRARKISYAC